MTDYRITSTLPVVPEFSESNWEHELIDKIRRLRQSRKRCIILIDGVMVFVFHAENAGTVRMAEP